MKQRVLLVFLLFFFGVESFTKCDVCQFLTAQIQKIVDANRTIDQTTFHRQSADVCRTLLVDEWLTVYCQYEVNQYALELYDIFVKRQDPKEVCESFGYCAPGEKGDPLSVPLRQDSNSKKSIPPIRAENDYSFVVLSDTHFGDTSRTEYVTWLTEVAIEKVNSLIKSEGIRMVFITGDITASALPEQWVTARKVLDKLKVPYFPILGNHDVWAYDNKGSYEEKEPTGDQLFSKTFGDLFTHQSLPGASVYYNHTPTYNQDEGIISYFQNWELTYQNFVFYGLDWNTRQHALPGWKGVLPIARINDYPGGTLPWLRTRLKTVSPSSQVVFLQHHPFAMPPFIPGFVFSFSGDKQKKIFQAIEESKANFWGVFAGHLHTWFNGTSGFGQSRQWLTEASKAASSISLAKVRGGEIVDISQLWGFDY